MQRSRTRFLVGAGSVFLAVCLAVSAFLWSNVRAVQADTSGTKCELATAQQNLAGVLTIITDLRAAAEQKATADSSSIADLRRALSDLASAVEQADMPGLRSDLQSAQREVGSVQTALESVSNALEHETVARETSIAELKSELSAATMALGKVREDLQFIGLQGVSIAGGDHLRIAYINAEDAFTVFTNAVSELRQKALDKRSEIVKLQGDFVQSTISKDQYQRRLNELNVELVEAQLDIDVGTIDRMLRSEGFADIRADLQKLRDAAQPVLKEVKNLVATAKLGVADSLDFQSRLSQVQSAFSQLDTLLTQAATLKIQQAARKIAVQKGYDLVIPTKNVIVYADQAVLPDITELVKVEIAGYL